MSIAAFTRSAQAGFQATIDQIHVSLFTIPEAIQSACERGLATGLHKPPRDKVWTRFTPLGTGLRVNNLHVWTLLDVYRLLAMDRYRKISNIGAAKN